MWPSSTGNNEHDVRSSRVLRMACEDNFVKHRVIIGFHNVWSGIPAVLTLVGWCLLIKSLIRFCAPKLALRMMSRVSVERSWEFQVAGAALVVLGGLLAYGIYVS